MQLNKKKSFAKALIYLGFFFLFILGYLFPNDYDMVFRALGIILSFCGALLLVLFAKTRRRS